MNATTVEEPGTDGPARVTTIAPRIPAAFRLQFIVPSNFLVVPWVVFVLTWAVSLGISFWIDALADGRVAAEEPMYSGAAQTAVWVLGFMAGYAVTQTLPFALALSFSRRTFVLGAYLAFAVVSAVFGAAFLIGAWIERATDGFGIHAYQFDLPFMTGSNGLAGAGLLAGMICLAIMIVAFLLTAVFRRLSLIGFWTLLIAIGGAAAVAALLIVQNVGTARVFEWFQSQTALTGSGYLAIIAVLAAVLGYVVLRRDTP